MADKKITELPAATLPIATGVKFEAVQGGINVQVDADDMPGSGAAGVTSVSGTTNRITSTGGATPVIDIDPAYDAAITAEIAAAIATAIATNRVLEVAFSDKVTPITAGTDKENFGAPYTTTILEIWVFLGTVQASGTTFTVDVNVNGSTMLSTKITVDNGEQTSLTAAVPCVISNGAWTKGDKVSIDVDQVGNGTALSGKIIFRG